MERSFALPSEENLLFSLVSRPRGMKAKSSADVPTLDAPLQVQLQQAGLYPPPVLLASRPRPLLQPTPPC